MMKASEYKTKCPYRDDCDSHISSPWGFTHAKSPDLNGKVLLIVGLNANESSLNLGDLNSKEYSNYAKGLIRGEVKKVKYKCLSNLMQPIARFLNDNDSTEFQLSALEHLNWCNIISCCPPPNTRRSKPTRNMIACCKRRLKEDQSHELINRISTIKPTHILVVGNDAKAIWQDVDCPDSELRNALNNITPRPAIVFSKHPSQTNITRLAYWDEVYSALSRRER